jgi:hypothetical protein
MSVYGTIKVEERGSHILVEDEFFDFYVFEKVDEWILRPKKIRDEYDAPKSVYEALWSQGYQVL